MFRYKSPWPRGLCNRRPFSIAPQPVKNFKRLQHKKVIIVKKERNEGKSNRERRYQMKWLALWRHGQRPVDKDQHLFPIEEIIKKWVRS